MLIKITLVLALILSIVIPFGSYLLSARSKGGFKISLACNLFFFFSTIIIANILMFTKRASAEEVAAVTTSANIEGLKYIGAALATGMSTVGAGIAVASAASAALGALSEDSSIMGKSLIFVALAEGVALYGLLISFMILNG